ncbi:MAG: TIGR04283 family arsenosugar biosynthesis glycosyltransferase [Planctomycetota bacterium]
MGESELTLAVVIPTLNEAGHIEDAIESARSAKANEIIVVDGGSTDETVAIAMATNARVIKCDRPGRGCQLALGADGSNSELLLFLHADNQLPQSFRKQYLDAGKPTWGGLNQQISAKGLRYRALEAGNAWRVQLTGRVFGDQAIFVRRKRYRQIGGFASIPLMEDVELSRRLNSFERPVLLPGPLNVSARRWKARGICRQTWLNWRLQWAYARGASPQTLAQRYRG